MDGIVVAVFGGCGVAIVELIKFILERKFKKSDTLIDLNTKMEEGFSNINEKIDEGFKEATDRFEDIEARMEKRQAEDARVRILRYSDELREGRKHSKESFDQTLADIDDYEDYCKLHPLFENNRTVLATQRIMDVYRKCERDNDFL